MLSTVLLIAAVLATGAVIFQVVARLGAFGPHLQEAAVRYSHMRTNIILGAMLWVAWAYLMST
jgi:hypothetical protein